MSASSGVRRCPRSSRNPRRTCTALLIETMLGMVMLWAMTFVAGAAAEQGTDPAEREALYEVLAGLNSEVDWATALPDPCLGYQEGIYCLPDDTTGMYHVTNLEFGFVSEYTLLVTCTENGTIHPAISRLPYLQSLLIFNCFVNGSMDATIPPEIGLLSASLQMLTLHGNAKLGGVLPPEMGNLTGLQRLVVTENSIGGPIPQELGNLRSLFQLDLSRNRLSGSIPGTLNSLNSLLIFNLGYNFLLSGDLPSLGGLNALQQLVLSYNNLSGNLPEDYGSLASLTYLDLSRNAISGAIPESFANLSQLEDLYLEGNSMGSPLPEFMGKMAGLVRVSLADAGFVGEIPPSLGDLVNVHVLDLQGNNFTGIIPTSLGDLPNVYQLNLNKNNLSGPVPFSSAFLGKLGTNLQVFDNSPALCVPPESLRDGVGVLGVKICDTHAGSLDNTDSTSRPGLGQTTNINSTGRSRKTAGIPTAFFFAVVSVLAHSILSGWRT